MRLLYDDATGKIYYAVKDYEWDYFMHSTNIPLTEFYIDDTNPDYKDIRDSLPKYVSPGLLYRVNENGEERFFIDGDGDLDDRSLDDPPWEEHIEEDF